MNNDDIVTLLREHWEDEKMLGNDLLAEALQLATNEIERLRAEIERLNGCLSSIYSTASYGVHGE